MTDKTDGGRNGKENRGEPDLDPQEIAIAGVGSVKRKREADDEEQQTAQSIRRRSEDLQDGHKSSQSAQEEWHGEKGSDAEILGYSEDDQGLRVEHISEEECGFLYQEIFVRQAYMQHGVAIARGRGDILDVGANIGLFALFCLQKLDDGSCPLRDRVFAFEPVRKISQVLGRNLKAYEGAHVRTYGLGASPSENERFVFYRESPGESTRNQLESERLKAVMGSVYESEQTEICMGQIRTVSQVIREESIANIQLLKIDVEGDELDVLMGIEKHDWNKIQQVSLEVHDENFRLSRIKGLLERQGFRVIVETQSSSWDEDFLLFVPREMNLHYVYAMR